MRRLRLSFVGLRGLLCLLLVWALASPSYAGLHIALFSRPPLVARSRVALADWVLTVETSRFTGEKICRLQDRKHLVSYARGALGFRVGNHLTTLGAWVKVDDGMPTRWRDMMPELVRLGVPMDGAGLDDPTDSTVWIPVRLLEDASRVAIQPNEQKRPQTFHLHGFTGLRDIAREQGCVPESRFVR